MKTLLAPYRRKKSDSPERPAAARNALPTAAVAELSDELNRMLPTLPSSDEDSLLDTSAKECPDGDYREIERLYAALGQVTEASCPRTFKLLDSSTRKISQKVIEEAGEVALETVKHRRSGVVRDPHHATGDNPVDNKKPSTEDGWAFGQ